MADFLEIPRLASRQELQLQAIAETSVDLSEEEEDDEHPLASPDFCSA
jgi:hypothetical protein